MKKAGLIFILLLVNLALLSAIPYPTGFHGSIIIKDSSNPNGQTLIGKINDIATGSCIISNNKYDIVLTDPIGTGGTIKFYIGNEKSDESFTFVTFDITESILTFKTIPANIGECGNDVCDEDECSLCPVDCGISECIGNGRCDIENGEDCTNSIDCVCSNEYSCVNGVCQSNDNNNGNNDGGNNDGGNNDGGNNNGGGGGGGGGPSNSPSSNDDSPLVTLSDDEDFNNDYGIKSTEKLNEESLESSVGRGITGGVIGFVKSGVGAGLIFALIIVLVGIGVISYKKNSLKNEI